MVVLSTTEPAEEYLTSISYVVPMMIGATIEGQRGSRLIESEVYDAACWALMEHTFKI